HVDPLDGGVDARLLLLLETPGPRGAEPRFVSRDNPTGTARNLRRFLSASGIERHRSLLWNAVPWTIHAPGARNRAPRRSEIEEGLSLLGDFISLLPVLRVVVTAGRVAALAQPLLRETRPELRLFAMPHPSPVYVNTSPSIAVRIATTLDAASECLGSCS
ncbi:MAG: uracil-DNA glycosylase, partial [Alphaproteobacteria bacterium]